MNPKSYRSAWRTDKGPSCRLRSNLLACRHYGVDVLRATEQIHLVDELPRTVTGKLQRYVLRERAEHRRGPCATPRFFE
jgi:acyl-coenzyme A synthetase/AMP-(fatty) acid ligase